VRTSVAGLAAVAVLGSCSRDSARSAPGATVPTTARSTTTTDPYAVPAVIDTAYVNKVLGALDQAVGEVARLVISANSIPAVVAERLRDVYADELVQLRLTSFRHDLDDKFSGYRLDPGNRKTTVIRLITVKPSCVFAEVSRDYSAVTSAASSSPTREWVGLVPRSATATNPTRWVLTYDGFTESGSEPPDTCAGS
jgi:hypothetical protein